MTTTVRTKGQQSRSRGYQMCGYACRQDCFVVVVGRSVINNAVEDEEDDDDIVTT